MDFFSAEIYTIDGQRVECQRFTNTPYNVDVKIFHLYLSSTRIYGKTRRPQPVQRQLRVTCPYHSTLQLQSSASFVVQKVFLLFSTRLQVDEEQHDAETGDTHGRQEVERCGIVVRRCGIDNSAGDNGTDERRGFADNVEERKKEEILASRCDFGDLNVSFSFFGSRGDGGSGGAHSLQQGGRVGENVP